jgi:hypothetical protein
VSEAAKSEKLFRKAEHGLVQLHQAGGGVETARARAHTLLDRWAAAEHTLLDDPTNVENVRWCKQRRRAFKIAALVFGIAYQESIDQ